MSASERKALSASLAAKSAETRSKTAEARRTALTAAQKGLRVLLAERLEARADAITARLEALALSTDNQTALRGMQLWLDRVHGRAVQPTQDVTPSVGTDLTTLQGMSLDELAALAHRLPTEPDPA